MNRPSRQSDSAGDSVLRWTSLGISLWGTLNVVFEGSRRPEVSVGKTRKTSGCSIFLQPKHLNLITKLERSKKDDGSQKKHLRTPRTNRRTPLTGGAEAHNGTPDGTTERPTRGSRQREARLKSEVNRAGRAKKNTALPVCFVSTLFEIASI